VGVGGGGGGPPHLLAQFAFTARKNYFFVILHWDTEAKFSDVIGTKVFRVYLFAIHSHIYLQILLPPPSPCCKCGLKLVCNVNIVYGNLKSESSQDYAEKPQPN
jgi:hypothetical protein